MLEHASDEQNELRGDGQFSTLGISVYGKN